MPDRILSLLGLCRRAGRISMGNDAVIASIMKGEARLVLCTEDISKNTKKKITYAAECASVPFFTVKRTIDAMSDALGKYCAVVAVNDAGFAKSLAGYIQTESEE